MHPLTQPWNTFISRSLARLGPGQAVVVPRWLEHPSRVGFSLLEIAEPVGQIRNWGLSLQDQSRIHIHEFADGRLVAHRDQYDPDQGVVPLVRHVTEETSLGKVLVGVAAASAFVFGVRYVASKLRMAR